MEAAWIGVIGALAGAALGSGITILGTRRLSKDERAAAENAENLRAFRLFVSEAALSVSEQLAGRFAAAYMDLRLRDLPSSVDGTVERTADYIAKLGEDRTPELKDEWKAIHAALMASGDELKAVARGSSPKSKDSVDRSGPESQPSVPPARRLERIAGR